MSLSCEAACIMDPASAADVRSCAAWVIEAHAGILTVDPMLSIRSWEMLHAVRFTEAQTAEIIKAVDNALRMVPGDIINDDPVELRPVRPARRLSFTSGHSTPGTKGGQLHSAVELERDAVTMAWAVVICAAIPIGFLIAKGLAAASIWIGENYAVHLFI